MGLVVVVVTQQVRILCFFILYDYIYMYRSHAAAATGGLDAYIQLDQLLLSGDPYP